MSPGRPWPGWAAICGCSASRRGRCWAWSRRLSPPWWSARGRALSPWLVVDDGDMTSDSVQVAERIERTAADVYAYVAQPTHIADWAPGLGDRVERDGDDWFVHSPMGRVKVVFAPPNEFGCSTTR